MHKLDQELYNLKMDVLQKHHLEARMESLVVQKTELEQKVMELEQGMRKEQADVAKLEQNSLSRLLMKSATKTNRRKKTHRLFSPPLRRQIRR